VQIGKWVKLPAAGPSLAAMDQAVGHVSACG